MTHPSVVGGKCVDSWRARVWGIEYATLGGCTRCGARVERVAVGRKSRNGAQIKHLDSQKSIARWKRVSLVGHKGMLSSQFSVELGDDIASPLRPSAPATCAKTLEGRKPRAPTLLPFNHPLVPPSTARARTTYSRRRNIESPRRISPRSSSSRPAVAQQSPSSRPAVAQQSPSSRPAAFCIRRLSCSPTRLDTLFAQINHATKSFIVSRAPHLCAAALHTQPLLSAHL
jgi:hypothetical protein